MEARCYRGRLIVVCMCTGKEVECERRIHYSEDGRYVSYVCPICGAEVTPE